MIGFRTFRTRGRAYSDRYMADASPIGAATSMAMPPTMRLAMNSVLMSYRPRRGNQPIVQRLAHSTWEMNVHASVSSDRTISALMINEISAALTPEGLVALNVQSTVDQESTPDIATAWLTENGLI